MAINVNGVTLPDIPADVLEKYPYRAILTYDTSTPNVVSALMYKLVVSSTELGRVTKELEPSLQYDTALVVLSETSVYSTTEYESDWRFDGTEESFMGFVGEIDGATGEVFWTNYDIREITGVSESGFVYGDVWFPNSETPFYALEYRVPTDDLLAIADQVRRLTGNSGKLTTEQMVSELSGVEKGIVLAENERIYQVGNAVSSMLCLNFKSNAVGVLTE